MNFSPEALKIVRILKEKGFSAFFAGGFVRDHLLSLASDDIDIATDALPEQILALFPQSKEVGLSFGVVIVREANKDFEIATFRKDGDYLDGRRPSSVSFATIEEDAKRRDFTINGMYLDPIEGKVVDLVAGRRDLEKGLIRAIGDPYRRFEEDYLRIIRALRFAVSLDFRIEEETEKALVELSDKLKDIAVERVWQELEKLRKKGKLSKALNCFHRYALCEKLFPELGSEGKSIHLESSSLSLIAYLTAVYPSIDLKTWKAFAKRFHLSREEQAYLESYDRARKLLSSEEVDDYTYCLFYADRFAGALLEVLAKDKLFHEENQKRLVQHIENHRKRNLPISSKELLSYGVEAKKGFGKLLSLAEKWSINENLAKEEILERFQEMGVFS